jgi:hypothetical protein
VGARGQQQVEEQVALVEPALAVAVTQALGHQVELGGAVGAGELAVVQTDCTDHRVGQATQAAHRRESHRAGGHATMRRIVELAGQRGMHHVGLQGLVEAGGLELRRQRIEGLAQLLHVVQRLGVGLHEAVQRAGQKPRPGRSGTRHGAAAAQGPQRLRKGPQAAERLGTLAFCATGRQLVGKGLVGGVGQGVAKKQPLQPVLQAVPRLCRQAQRFAVLTVEGPVHAGVLQPVVDAVEAGVVEVEAARHQRLLQQPEDLADRRPRGRPATAAPAAPARRG